MTQSANASRWDVPADNARLARTAEAFKSRGINALIVDTAAQAKVFELLPQNAEVFTSVTLDGSGLAPELNDSGRFSSVRKRVSAVDQAERRRAATVAKYVLGSVHAITEDGRVMLASASGSQIAPNVYGAEKGVWVVGAQKVVKDLDEAFAPAPSSLQGEGRERGWIPRQMDLWLG